MLATDVLNGPSCFNAFQDSVDLVFTEFALFAAAGPAEASTSSAEVVINLGGEGEVAGVVNVQGDWIIDAAWRSSRGGRSLDELLAAGNEYHCRQYRIALRQPDGRSSNHKRCSDDKGTWLGPGVQSSEVWRILKEGGTWINDGVIVPRP